ncbi:MAG: helix-turn-helix domain-containing protein [Acidobacteria bacterium]|nr:helix-turn-helix domain-containing protein [Acidobacteriota bacterium]
MGAAARIKPKRLAGKLRRIRLALGLSQSDMVRRLGYEGIIAYHRISNYELGTGEPPLPVLLEYARLAGVSTDVLIDDKQKLPDKLPAKPKR